MCDNSFFDYSYSKSSMLSGIGPAWLLMKCYLSLCIVSNEFVVIIAACRCFETQIQPVTFAQWGFEFHLHLPICRLQWLISDRNSNHLRQTVMHILTLAFWFLEVPTPKNGDYFSCNCQDPNCCHALTCLVFIITWQYIEQISSVIHLTCFPVNSALLHSQTSSFLLQSPTKIW